MRLTIEYPRQFEALIDEAALRETAASAFEFHLVKRPQADARLRIPQDKNIGDLSPADLLGIYWKASNVEDADRKQLEQLASQIIQESPAED